MEEFQEVKIEVFIPDEYIDELREELSRVNVGVIGNYDHCVSIITVRGYWRPLEGANPFDGEVGRVSQGTECKLEVNCKRQNIQAALEVIYCVHPYEEPLVNLIPLVNHLYQKPQVRR